YAREFKTARVRRYWLDKAASCGRTALTGQLRSCRRGLGAYYAACDAMIANPQRAQAQWATEIGRTKGSVNDRPGAQRLSVQSERVGKMAGAVRPSLSLHCLVGRRSDPSPEDRAGRPSTAIPRDGTIIIGGPSSCMIRRPLLRYVEPL